MAVQANTNLTTDFAKAQSIDFTNRFVDGIQKLQELLGITRRTAMANGSIIKVIQKQGNHGEWRRCRRRLDSAVQGGSRAGKYL